MAKKHVTLRNFIFIFLFVSSSIITSQGMESIPQKQFSEMDNSLLDGQDDPYLKKEIIDISRIHGRNEKNADVNQDNRPISQSVSAFDPVVENASIREGYAVMCGVSDYPGTDNDLSYCDDDVNDLSDFAQSEFHIPEENIIRLIDSEVTKSGISEAISDVSDVMDENDMLFFSYSGHGSAALSTPEYSWNIQSPHPYYNNMDSYWHYSAPGAVMMRVHFTTISVEYGYDGIFVGDNSDRYYYWDLFTGSYSNIWSYWVMCDDIYVNLYTDYSVTDWGFAVDKVEVAYYVAPYDIIPYDGLTDGLTGSELGTMFDQVPGTSMILLDSCHSGGVGADLQGTDRYILAASEADEYSLEDPSYGNGVFSYQFLNVWDLSEDANLDGALTFQEIFPQLQANTVSRSTSMGYTHHPQEFDGVNVDVSFIPSAKITRLYETEDEDIFVEYHLRGLGEGKLTIITYDMQNETLSTSYATPNYSVSPAGDIMLLDIDDTAGGIICTLTSEYRGFVENSTVFLPLGFSSYSDSDLDGLSDLEEFELFLDPWNNDTDGDGMNDGYEVHAGLDPLIDDSLNDPDFDDLSNIDEYLIGTEPFYYDTDEDGCPDGWEIAFNLDPFEEMDATQDIDGDGLNNLLEFQNSGNPYEIDTDGDGLTDDQEYQIGTALNVADTNSDGISDDLEDPDFDDLSNFQEFALGTNPLYWDSDKDGCPDGWELDNFLDPLDFLDGISDSDGDGLVNYLEYQNFGDPAIIDTDEDGLTDYEEFLIGTLLDNPDTDGDTFSDNYEMNFNTDPFDPNSTPFKNRILPGLVIIPTGVVLSILLRRKLKK